MNGLTDFDPVLGQMVAILNIWILQYVLFCGTGLISTRGLTRRTGLEEHTMVSAGPMCRYAQDLAPFLQVLVGNNISKLQLDVEVGTAGL